LFTLPISNFNYITSPATKVHLTGRASGGLIVGINKSIKYKVLSKSEHWILIETNNLIKESSINICFAYVPPYSFMDNKAKQLYDLLTLHCDSNPNLLLMSDLNARVGLASKSYIEEDCFKALFPNFSNNRCSKDNLNNKRGNELLKFCDELGLIILNGRTKGDSKGDFTFISNNKQGSSIIDLIVSNLNEINDLHILNWTDSDHLPISVSIPHKNLSENIYSDNDNLNCYNRFKWNTEGKDKFINSLNNSNPFSTDNNIYQHNITNAVTEALKNSNMTNITNTHKKSSKAKPWFDSECLLQRQLMHGYLDMYRKYNLDTYRKNYIGSKTEYKSIINKKKQNYLQEYNKSIIKSQSRSEFWFYINQFKYKPRNHETVPFNSLLEHYKNIFSSNTSMEHSTYLNNQIVVEKLDNPFKLMEVSYHIDLLKNNKAPGLDGITNEIIKKLPISFLQNILNLYNNILETGNFPTNWASSIILPIHKTGDTTNPNNYRPISLLPTLTKLLTGMISTRLSEWCDENNIIPEEQAGFRQHRGCLDHIFTLNAIIQSKLSFKKGKVYAFFIDLSQAFDRINHSILFSKLYNLGISAKIINLIKNMYSEANARLKSNSNMSQPFSITNGVLQGEILSPLLFSLCLNDLPNLLNNSEIPAITISDTPIHCLLYADDIVVLADSAINLQKKINLLKNYFETNLLLINLKKSKIMVFKKKGGTLKHYEKWFWGNKKLDVVNEYRYLGVIFSSSGVFIKNAKSSLKKSNMAMNRLWSLFCNSGMSSMRIRFKLFDTIVKNALLYSSPIWALRYTDHLETLQSKFIKKILYLHPSTPHYILRLETSRPKIQSTIYKHTLILLTKLLVMPENRFPKLAYNHLKRTAALNPNNSTYNWTLQVQTIFINAGLPALWESQDPELICENIKIIMNTLSSITTQEDLARVELSSRFSYYNNLYNNTLVPYYLHNPFTPIHVSRVIAQLRLNINTIRLGNKIYKLDDEIKCSICNINENETLMHLIIVCPLYKNLRKKYIPFVNKENFYISLNDPSLLLNFYNLMYKIILNRNILLNI